MYLYRSRRMHNSETVDTIRLRPETLIKISKHADLAVQTYKLLQIILHNNEGNLSFMETNIKI